MKTDAEIGCLARLRPIGTVVESIGVPEGRLIPYGRYAAKLDAAIFEGVKGRADGRLVVVTSIARLLRAKARPPLP